MDMGFQVKLWKVRSINRGLNNSWRLKFFYVNRFIEHSTPRKATNVLAAKAQKWLKRDKVWGMPYRYTIDPLNVCNLRCPLCPTGIGTLKRARGKMSLENFQNLIDQITPYAYLVELYNWSEPFLHPQIIEMIVYASTRKISVRMSANLNRFNRDMARKTLESGLDAVIVSVDGATQATYEKYRRKGNLATVLKNIQLLSKRNGLPKAVLLLLHCGYSSIVITKMKLVKCERSLKRWRWTLSQPVPYSSIQRIKRKSMSGCQPWRSIVTTIIPPINWKMSGIAQIYGKA